MSISNYFLCVLSAGEGRSIPPSAGGMQTSSGEDSGRWQRHGELLQANQTEESSTTLCVNYRAQEGLVRLRPQRLCVVVSPRSLLTWGLCVRLHATSFPDNSSVLEPVYLICRIRPHAFACNQLIRRKAFSGVPRGAKTKLLMVISSNYAG